MRYILRSISKLWANRVAGHRSANKAGSMRPGFEVLEARDVPATASGLIQGTAFVDVNRNGVFDRTTESALLGARVTLVSSRLEAPQNPPVRVTAVTDANGNFSFRNVLPGAYRIIAHVQIGAHQFRNIASGVLVVREGNPHGTRLHKDAAFQGITARLWEARLFFPARLAALQPGSGVARANVRPNNAPVVSANIPAVVVAEDDARVLDLSAFFSDPDLARGDETLTFSIVSEAFGAGDNPDLVAPQLNQSALTLDALAGELGTAHITVRATDRFGSAVEQTFTFTARPRPVISPVAVAPDSLTNAQVLSAVNPTAAVVGGAPITFIYQWLKNGTPIAGATDQSLNLASVTGGVAPGDKLSVRVTPIADSIAGDPFTRTVTINNVSPTTLVRPAISAVAINADNDNNVTGLTANPTASMATGEQITFRYQWLQNGTPISGATNQTLSLNGLTVAVGDTFAVQVIATANALDSDLFTSLPKTVATASPDPITLQP